MKQRGFSMVELLIALVIGLFLIGGILQAFLSSNHTYLLNESLAKTQENGRFSLEFVSRDIRSAGYNARVEACAGSVNFFREAPFDNEDDLEEGYIRIALEINEDDARVDSYINSFKKNNVTAVEGYDYNRSNNSWSPVRPVELNGINNIRSDIILIKRSDTSRISDGFPVLEQPGGSPPVSADMKILDSNQVVKQDDIVLVVDERCSRAAVFQVSSITTNTGNGETNLRHNKGTSGAGPGNRTNALGYDFKDGRLLLAKGAGMEEIYYYVRLDANGLPTLFRMIDGVEQPLVEGVDEFELEYRDKNGNSYVSADAITDFDDVVSVRIWFLVRGRNSNVATNPIALPTGWPDANTPDPYPSNNGDGALRQVFSTTVAIRNRLE